MKKIEIPEKDVVLMPDFEYIDWIVLDEEKVVAVFTGEWSGDLEFVGKIYSFEGKEIQIIPFPPKGYGGRENCYWYSSITNSQLMLYFHQENERDFGGVYSLKEKKYVGLHEAR